VSTPVIYLALPALDELEYIPGFIECLKRQTFVNFEFFVCINQPDRWWDEEDNIPICLRNGQTLEYLQNLKGIPITVIDRSTKGKGWNGKNFGVGWARKVAMDAINQRAQKNDIIVSIDADTIFHENYLQSLCDTLTGDPGATALAVPYYHPLTGDAITDRCILRYEIYMRYYAVNMWRIANPYRFTAIGSAMALPIWAYRTVGGITPHKSGEDFYFMQKLCKQGRILHWNEEYVYPAARFSDRVFFGTGPAMIKGRIGDWSSYPIYHYSLFDEVKETYDLFTTLFKEDAVTPMDGFLYDLFDHHGIWQPLRDNYKTQERFVRACATKVDGLRILQYLKAKQKNVQPNDEENLKTFFTEFYSPEHLKSWNINPGSIDFDKMDLVTMNNLRDFMASHENHCRRSGHYTLT
jgi:glycosyltransferase involved in cell wall biosynthesis